MIADVRPKIVCLQETKIQRMSTQILLSTLGTTLDRHIELPAQGTRGGVLLAWNSMICQELTTHVDEYTVSVLFQTLQGRQWWFTGVYGPQLDAHKLLFLQELRNVRAGCPGPWLMARDFNLIYQAEDKNNNNIDRAMIGRFRHLINDLELQEIDLIGRRYMWSSERNAPTLVLLDRAFCNNEWDLLFPNHILHSTAAGISDHCPLIVALRGDSPEKRRFHFESFWPRLEGFQDTIAQAWNATTQGLCPIEKLANKLRATSRALQSWSQRKVGSVKTQLDQARELLLRFDVAQETRVLTVLKQWLRRKLKQHCLALASLHRTIVRFRSRIDCLAEGDADTRFFHSHAKFHKRKCFIPTLHTQDRMVTTHEEKEEVVWEFFHRLLGTPETRTRTLGLEAFYQGPHELSDLDCPISEEEVWSIIKQLPPDKAPGPDGFTGRFYHTCWGLIKLDLMVAIGAVHGGDSRKLNLLNNAFMVLIPKKANADRLTDFRAISLVHSFAKLVTKILANRLAPKLGNIIAKNQSAFIKGRRIHDNFLMVQHMAKTLHGQKRSSLMLKLDITKAFDSVSWPFLLEILGRFGFGDQWRTTICNLLATSTMRVMLNGEPGPPIAHRHGLRQRDPLSPMLFIMLMDVLTGLFNKVQEQGLLLPLMPRLFGHRLSIYANDVILFTIPGAPQLHLIKTILGTFGEASGLKVNMRKSQVIPIACSPDQVQQANTTLQCQITQLPCRYLGLPLAVRKLKIAEDRIVDKLPGWKAVLLQCSGWLILVRAVLTAIPIHVLIALDAPKWIIKTIDKIRRGFLCKERTDITGGHCPIAWERVMRPLHLGGLGIHNLETLGCALKMRWLWIQKTLPEAMSPQIDCQIPPKARALFAACITTQLGDGKEAKFWTDRWLHRQAILDLMLALVPYVWKRGWRKRTVAEALQHNSWVLDIIRGVSVQAIWQVVRLVNILGVIQLQIDQQDLHIWTREPSGKFSTKSTYEAFFMGGIQFEP